MNFKHWLNESKKLFQYIGQCDRLRKLPGGNEKWLNMIDKAKPIGYDEFINHVDMSPLLDEDEDENKYFSDLTEVDFFTSVWGNKPVYYFGARGFEFIFIQN